MNKWVGSLISQKTMRNAKVEFLKAVEDQGGVKCASIQFDDNEPQTSIVLKVNHSEQDYDDFLDRLNFNYNNGFGRQMIFGTIWLKNGTWVSRGEYDGSEWWRHNVIPDIPNECL